LPVDYFKPRGIPLVELEEVSLSLDEREALRLGDLLEMPYEDAGKAMGISRATFGRIIRQARKVVSNALINGKAIRIEGGSCAISDALNANGGFESDSKGSAGSKERHAVRVPAINDNDPMNKAG